MRRRFHFGSFFSGLDAPALSCRRILKSNTKYKFRHELFVDTSRACRKLGQQVFAPKLVIDNSNKWNTIELGGSLDLFWHSPCCQSYSSLAKGVGWRAKDGKGNMLRDSMAFIGRNKPVIVGFEQVPNVLNRRHQWIIKKMLRKLEAANYEVHSAVLSARQHGNYQARRRFFVFGLRRDRIVAGKVFRWPQPVKPCTSFCDDVLDNLSDSDEPCKLPPRGQAGTQEVNRQRRLVKAALQKLKAQHKSACKAEVKIVRAKLQGKSGSELVTAKILQKHRAAFKRDVLACTVDIGSSLRFAAFKVGGMPTITRTRSAAQDYWLLSRGRRIRVSELARAQGMDLEGDFGVASSGGLPGGVTRSQFCGMIGNSIPIELLLPTIRQCLHVTGYL